MSLLSRFFTVLLFLVVVGVLVASVARKLVRTVPAPTPVKILNANEAYQFRNAHARKAR